MMIELVYKIKGDRYRYTMTLDKIGQDYCITALTNQKPMFVQ